MDGFSTKKIVFFFFFPFFLLFFSKNLILPAERRRFLKNKHRKKGKFWTDFQLKKGNFWTDFQLYSIYICVIYVCCRVNIWSKNCPLGGQYLVQVVCLLFFFCFLNKIFLKLGQHLVQLCCATCLDQILTQPWTRYWLNLGSFCCCLLFAKATIFIAFSAKRAVSCSPHNIRNTSCEHNCANWKMFVSWFVSTCLLFGVSVSFFSQPVSC